MTTVSVVIPFRGRPEWLVEAVESVLAQTYQDFEIIIVDDGSDSWRHDDVFDDERVRCLHQEHSGATVARNHGIHEARGRYIAFLDDDDLFLPPKLEVQVEAMERQPDALLSHTSCLRIDPSGATIGHVKTGQFSGDVFPRILFNCPITTSSVVMRSAAFDLVGGFDPSLKVGDGEDVVFWAEIAKRSPILGIDEPLTKVRVHHDSTAFLPGADAATRWTIVHRTSLLSGSWLLRRQVVAAMNLDLAVLAWRLSRDATAHARPERRHPIVADVQRLVDRRGRLQIAVYTWRAVAACPFHPGPYLALLKGLGRKLLNRVDPTPSSVGSS